MAKTAKKKQATDAEMIEAGLLDRDPYAGLSPAELKIRAAAEAANEPRNMLRDRLRRAGVTLTDAELRRHLQTLSPFLLRAFLTPYPESGHFITRLVYDTAVADIVRLTKRSTTRRANARVLHDVIANWVKTIRDELSEGGIKKVRKKKLDGKVAANLSKIGMKVSERTIRRVRQLRGL